MMPEKTLRSYANLFCVCQSVLAFLGTLFLVSCSGGGGENLPPTTPATTSQNTTSSPSPPTISIARVIPNVQQFRVHGNDLIWSDGDPFVGLKKASMSGGSEIPLSIRMNEPLSLRVQGQDVYWVEEHAVSNTATKVIVKSITRWNN
jgi:hypothetical protein